MVEPKRATPHLRAVDSPSGPRPEHELIERALAGNPAAWTKLYQSYYHAISRHVLHLVRNVDVIEDLVQEVFTIAFVKLNTFESRSSFSTWLHGVAINVVRKHWSTNKRRAQKERAFRELPQHVTSAHGPDITQMRRARADALLAAVERLPDNLRLAFLLVDLRELEPSDAAAQLNITTNNLHVRAHRARKRIKQLLREAGWEVAT